MRLVYISRNCTLDNGNSRIAWELARESARRGHETHLLARRFPNSAPGGVQMRRIFQLPKIFGKWRSISFAWLSSRAAARLAGVTHGLGDALMQDVLTVGNVDWNYGKRIPGRRPSESAVRIKKTALENAARFSKFAVVVSSQLKRDVLDLVPGFPEDRLRVIYPGVDLERYQPMKRLNLRRKLSSAYGIPESAVWIACAAGGDFEKRNLKTLGEALSALSGRQDWIFVFAGAGKGQFPWPANLASRSFFLGSVPDLSEALPACDLLAYPAWFDEFAMVCSEAMASGLPVILSRATGASEILPASNGADIIENPGDTDSIRRRIEYYLDHPEARLRAGEENRRAAQPLGWTQVYDAYEKLYEEILERRKNDNYVHGAAQ